MRRIRFVLILILVLIPTVVIAERQYPKNIWMAIIAESANGSYDEHYAIACCFKNRLDSGMSLGSVGYKRKNLYKFVSRQSSSKKEQAKLVVEEVFYSDEYEDTTFGAVYFDNIHKYGIPKWVRTERLKKTVKIGEHTFYRKRKL